VGRNLTRQSYFDITNVGATYTYSPSDRSNYHSLQINFVRSMSKGLQAMANYNWSKSIDTASSELTPGAIRNGAIASGDRGLSTFDRRQVFNLTLSYDIPTLSTSWKPARMLTSGWSIDSIFRASTGTPLTVLVGFEDTTKSGAGVYYRPDIVPGKPLWISDPASYGGMSLNPDAFDMSYLDGVQTLTRVQGNAPRGIATSPSTHQADLTMRREFKLSEKIKLQCRMDAFNFLNESIPGTPSTYFGWVYAYPNATTKIVRKPIAGFGQVKSSAINQRTMQLALKLTF
jgi:hypothetical protein